MAQVLSAHHMPSLMPVGHPAPPRSRQRAYDGICMHACMCVHAPSMRLPSYALCPPLPDLASCDLEDLGQILAAVGVTPPDSLHGIMQHHAHMQMPTDSLTRFTVAGAVRLVARHDHERLEELGTGQRPQHRRQRRACVSTTGAHTRGRGRALSSTIAIGSPIWHCFQHCTS